MERFLIQGGRPLRGIVEVRGSKNAVSKMMVASLLTDEPCTIEEIPQSSELDITRELCESVGSAVSIDGRSCSIRTQAIKSSLVPKLSRRNRIPILAIGPLLHRCGKAEVPVLGGDPIGHRPINFHLDALSRMGVRIERREDSYVAEASQIHGADIEFPYPSVGATENVLLTAVRAKGITTIHNAALEPEIMNLIQMLMKMGAGISVDTAQRTITIEGVGRLAGATIRAIPDRNEIVSFASAALATDGDVFIPGVEESYLWPFLGKLKEVGASYELRNGGIRFWGRRPYRTVSIETAPHPAFMTDWQQPSAVLLTQANGTSIIHETVYEERFGYLKDLQRMGGRVEVTDDCLGVKCRFFGHTFNHSVRIMGPTKLHGAEIAVQDIRAGMAHIIAALVSQGESVISGVEHIDRGYEKIDERLRELGADIKRV